MPRVRRMDTATSWGLADGWMGVCTGVITMVLAYIAATILIKYGVFDMISSWIAEVMMSSLWKKDRWTFLVVSFIGLISFKNVVVQEVNHHDGMTWGVALALTLVTIWLSTVLTLWYESKIDKNTAEKKTKMMKKLRELLEEMKEEDKNKQLTQ